MLAEIAFAAEGLHIHRYPVAGAHGFDRCTDGFHHTHHLVADGDTGHGTGYGTVLDVQVAGADRAQRHPHDGIPGIDDLRLRLVQQRKMVVFYVGQGFHECSPFEIPRHLLCGGVLLQMDVG